LIWHMVCQLRIKIFRLFVKKLKHYINTAKPSLNYDSNVDGFNGVTIAEFDADRKICDLKEFQSKAEHYYPYGE